MLGKTLVSVFAVVFLALMPFAVNFEDVGDGDGLPALVMLQAACAQELDCEIAGNCPPDGGGCGFMRDCGTYCEIDPFDVCSSDPYTIVPVEGYRDKL